MVRVVVCVAALVISVLPVNVNAQKAPESFRGS